MFKIAEILKALGLGWIRIHLTLRDPILDPVNFFA